MSDMRIPRIPPRRLILAGGGVRVISYMGVLQVLQENQLMGQLREIGGVSAGALVALMLALQYSQRVLERFCYEYNFHQLQNIDPEQLFLAMDQLGVDTGEKLEQLIHKILHHKGFAPNVTFGELAASGKTRSLRVWASDLERIQMVEFSAEQTPHIEVALAVRASMSYPMYYTPVKHPDTNTLLVDGGMLDNFPMSVLSEEEAAETIGCVFTYKEGEPLRITNLTEMLSVLTMGYYMPVYQKILQKYRDSIICIPCAHQSVLDFDISTEHRQQLVLYGRQATEEFLQKVVKPNMGRRHSVS